MNASDPPLPLPLEVLPLPEDPLELPLPVDPEDPLEPFVDEPLPEEPLEEPNTTIVPFMKGWIVQM